MEKNIDPNVWRLGPAKLIYDMTGSPTDVGNLDYSTIVQSKPFEITEIQQAEKDKELESALNSIGKAELEIADNQLCSNSEDTKNSSIRSLPPVRTINFETDQAVANLITIMLMETEMKDDSTTLQQLEDNDDSSSYGIYSLVTQLEWEKDIIWDAEEEKSRQLTKETLPKYYLLQPPNSNACKVGGNIDQSGFQSLLPFENEELARGDWTDNVIWDVDDFLMDNPQPIFMSLDPSNEDYVFKMPDDKPIPQIAETFPPNFGNFNIKFSSKKVRESITKQHQHHAGHSANMPEKTQSKSELKHEAISTKEKFPYHKDFYNFSNDNYYQYEKKGTDKLLQLSRLEGISSRHSMVVKMLKTPFIKTSLSSNELALFHRPPLRKDVNAPITNHPNQQHFIKSLTARITQKAKEWGKKLDTDQQITLNSPIDISGRDGYLLLIENSEEYPPLLSQVGMCSKIINYHCCTSLNNQGTHQSISHQFGESSFVHALPPPYLGTLKPGETFCAVENNMYCSPVYFHSSQDTDFLLIRNRHGYLIRDISATFVAGQQCPLIEVPEPDSAKVKDFLKEFVQTVVFYKFRELVLSGKTAEIKVDYILSMFPTVLESNIKTWFKTSVDFKKDKNDVSWIVQKNGFVLSREDDLENKVSPEQCCAYYSMLAAQHRLKNAGWGSLVSLSDREPSRKSKATAKKGAARSEKSTIIQQRNNSKLAEELEAAPWNTTSAFLDATKGKCVLEIEGLADPTGCGEGFSYVRTSNRAQICNQLQGFKENKLGNDLMNGSKTTGSNLRKLSGKETKNILLKRFNIPEEKLQKLSRWDAMDMLRKVAGEKLLKGESVDERILNWVGWKGKNNLTLLNRGCHKDNCQRIFELQNKILSSTEVLSTDEDEDNNDGNAESQGLSWNNPGDIETMGKSIENILNAGKKASEVQAAIRHEEEEKERLQLQMMMLGKVRAKDSELARKKELTVVEKEKQTKGKNILQRLSDNPQGYILQLTRTFKDDNGKSFTRVEIVRDPQVVAAYVKLRSQFSDDFIKSYLKKMDLKEKIERQQKEFEIIRELRAKQAMKEEEAKNKKGKKKDSEYFPNKNAKVLNERKLNKKLQKCGKCGLLGHKRSSPACPCYDAEAIKKKAMKKKMTKNAAQKNKQGSQNLKEEESSESESSPSSSSDSRLSSDSDDDGGQPPSQQIPAPDNNIIKLPPFNAAAVP